MKKLKAGIIGLGVGEQHIAGYQQHQDCEVVALCDFSDQKLTMAKKKYPSMRVIKNSDDILQDPSIDIVSIASYDNYHFEQIIKAIKYNKHIFIEKPLCLYENEAKKIRKALKEKPNLKISSNLILRISPRFRELKEQIQAGKLGKLFYTEGDYNYGKLHKITKGWRGQIPYYSVVYGGAIHIIDLMLWLTGDSITEVTAKGNNIASKGSTFKNFDLVVSILKFKSGLLGKITSNFGCVYPHFHKVSIYGTDGTFENGLTHAHLFKSRDPEIPANKIKTKYSGTHKGALIYSFVDSIANNTIAEVTKEDIFKTMSVCFAIEKAINKSCSIKINYI